MQARWGSALLRVNGWLLAAVGGVQSLGDLASHFFGVGPLGTRLQGSTGTIGFFEAHGLAVIVGSLLVLRSREAGAAWHVVAAATHVLLGGANLVFWPAFEHFDMVPAGVAATVGHGVFAVLQAAAAVVRAPPVFAGLGGRFRLAAAVTFATGLALHASSLALGREVFVTRIFTPQLDLLLLLPMTYAAVSGWRVFSRTRSDHPLTRPFLAVLLAYVTISVPIHVRGVVTWRTDYVLSFPDWYSVPILGLLVVLLAFVLRVRFESDAPAAAADAQSG